MAQKIRVRDHVPEIREADQPGLFQQAAGLPPCQTFGHRDTEKHGLAVDQGVQDLLGRPAAVQGEAPGLETVFPLFVAGQQAELAGIGNQALFGQSGGNLPQARAGRHVEKDFAARRFGRAVQKDLGFVPQPAAGRQGEHKQQAHYAQHGFHAGLRCSGGSARKEARMRTAACWSSTALRLRAVSPASRRSDQASSELSSSGM